jgi:hypothetical protein
MKIYYAHAMPTYRTATEERELRKISSMLPRARIVNPAKYQKHPEKQRDKIGFCLRLVEASDAVVFSRFRGKVTAGVGKEVNYALRMGLPVFQLTGSHLKRQRSPVRYLSVYETLRLYGRL